LETTSLSVDDVIRCKLFTTTYQCCTVSVAGGGRTLFRALQGLLLASTTALRRHLQRPVIHEGVIAIVFIFCNNSHFPFAIITHIYTSRTQGNNLETRSRPKVRVPQRWARLLYTRALFNGPPVLSQFRELFLALSAHYAVLTCFYSHFHLYLCLETNCPSAHSANLSRLLTTFDRCFPTAGPSWRARASLLFFQYEFLLT